MNEILLGSALFVGIVLALTIAVLVARALLLPSGAVTITINGGNRIKAQAGGKLLGALTGAGIAIPAACGGVGTCGQCRVRVTQGGGEVLPTEMARLTRREIAGGMRLACQVSLRNDVSTTVPDALLSAREWACTVASSRTVAPLIREIVLDLLRDEPFAFRPGAFVQVTAPPYRLAYADFDIAPEHHDAWAKMGTLGLVSESAEPVSRAYSIASTPQTGANRIVLLVRLALPPPSLPLAPPGVVSSWLFGLRAGDRVTVSGPFGTFGAQESDREMVFIGGGVGMAPLRAIIADRLERLGTTRKISFWYGARSRVDLFYQEEFDRLQAEHMNFSWTVALSDASAGDVWDGATGFIHDVVWQRLLRDHPAPEVCEYYLCGPPMMIGAVLAMLDDAGVDPESIFNDDFGG
ncbi:NADH:ubiquinone reductase (Na(+)-transporting) subunit F [Phaeovulum sp.]|uniref:NADH:ubiquinone reductase (Na(+)-transporting) subunit F n=1 Tax=Phaeovulum sp. TaxID=2934796 RepID=UPI002730EBA3|nr:NADH:ubiquinone reductase (Na(+)-transporting) subunit F [Phaeovulum sp.]MDP1667841.1 NADH:ubiquinone reductase (Na(+)-transporting) subunit F [Phaeovulum sp.]MDZ4120418.1 NADH:ubiquinone reductase (Na(+)-transporting) subunit F [Phaeovulum sp.]